MWAKVWLGLAFAVFGLQWVRYSSPCDVLVATYQQALERGGGQAQICNICYFLLSIEDLIYMDYLIYIDYLIYLDNLIYSSH